VTIRPRCSRLSCYHFSNKDVLLDEALLAAMHSCEGLVTAVRASVDLDDPTTVGRVMEAVWQWTVDHPEQAVLLSGPFTATPESRRTRDEWEERHVARGFAYLASCDDATVNELEMLRRQLAVRTLIRLSISVHILRQPDGPLVRHSPHGLSKAVRDVSNRLVR